MKSIRKPKQATAKLSKSKTLFLSSKFSTINLAIFALIFAGLGGHFLFYSHASSVLPADINNDGIVDVKDLSLLLSNYGSNSSACVTASQYTCDLDSDGKVTVVDLSILLSNFGQSAPTDPSGQPMPVGDISGWHQIFTDDFITNVPSGEGVASGGQAGYFPQAVSDKWTAYPWPWTGTPNWANYFPERTTSIHDGMMDIHLHSETINGTDYHLIDAPEPLVNGPSGSPYLNSGRYVIRFKTDNFPDYHGSYLLWPQWDDTGQQSWPGSGEIDFPEADYNDSSISGFIHMQNGTSGGDQLAYNINTPIYGAWHTAVIEWKSGTSCSFYLDGTLVGTSTTRIPQSPMRWVIQSGGSFGISSPAPDSVNGHIYIDWVAVYTGA